jgi:CRP-like cAMP-binding protein
VGGHEGLVSRAGIELVHRRLISGEGKGTSKMSLGKAELAQRNARLGRSQRLTALNGVRHGGIDRPAEPVKAKRAMRAFADDGEAWVTDDWPALRTRLFGPSRVVQRGKHLCGAEADWDHLYLIESGWIASTLTFANGARHILKFSTAGDIVGMPARARAARELAAVSFEAECLSECQVASCTGAKLDQMARTDPEAFDLLRRCLWVDLAQAYSHLANLGCNIGVRKVGALLLELAQRAGLANAGGPVTLPLNQRHLAEALGLTNVYVSKMLKALREEGLIEWGRGGVVLRNIGQLERRLEAERQERRSTDL